MKLIERVKRISGGRIGAFLDSLDDPAAVVPQLMRELDEQVEALMRAETKALTAVKASNRRLDEAIGRVARLGRGAELALRFGEEKTAREALAQQVAAENAVRAAEQDLARAEKAHREAGAVRGDLLRQQRDLQQRFETLRQRRQGAAAGRAAGEAVEAVRRAGDSILDQVAAMEDGPMPMPAPATRLTAGAARTAPLMDRLSDLEKRVTVEERLAALRRQTDENVQD